MGPTPFSRCDRAPGSAPRRVVLICLCFFPLAACSIFPPSSARRVPRGLEWKDDVNGYCREVRRAGVFNAETFAASPELAAVVERKLCRSDVAVVGIETGFGVGTEVYGMFLRERDYALDWRL